MTVKTIEPQDGADTELDDGETEQENEDQGGIDTELENEQKKESQQKLSALGEIKSAQSKIDSGKMTPEEFPQWMKNDLKPKEEKGTPEDLEAKITKKVRDDLEFENLQKTLPKDLTQEQADKMNEVIESEIKLGRSQVEAFNYAVYQAEIKISKSDPRESFIRATTVPIITPRLFERKKESLVKTEADSEYVRMIKETQGINLV